jgi:cell division transport system ATP-binding protein
MLEFVNVSKFYNHFAALDDITFEIEEKEFTFLVGPSGSGKTTIIKLLIREEDPTSGNIYFYENDITRLKPSQIIKLRRDIGVVFQDFKLLPQKNLFENVAFALEVSGKKLNDIEETVNYVLELVDLADRAEAFPHEISGGEKQKIAIARAVANNPKVLIADEPTGNLDPKSSWEIINLLQKINQWGTTVIMATHGSDIVDTLGKRVIQLDRGKIISDNKKGAYPKPVVPLVIPEVQKDEKETSKKDEEMKKKIQSKKDEKEEIKDKEAKPNIEEKEFEITFTTKQKLPSSKKTSKKSSKRKKRKGKDVVDLYKLKLGEDVESTLIQAGIGTIKMLRKKSEEDLKKIKGLDKRRISKILKALEKKP